MPLQKLSYLALTSLVILAGVLVYGLGYAAGIFTILPTNTNLVHWDASWYQSIVQNGYYYLPDEQSNAGFFPGFPLLWKALGGSPLLMSLVNALLFLIGIYVLNKTTRATTMQLIYLMTVPSALFFFVPYSEALFFLFGAGIIYSWERKKLKLLLVMAILAALVRPVFFFLLPAIVLTHLLTYKKRNTEIGWKQYLLIFTGVIFGALLGFSIIAYYTGDFFAYSKSQVEQWNHTFGWPSLPFTTWRGARMLWLDGLGLFVVVLAMISLVKMTYTRFVKFIPVQVSAMEIMSLGYLVMIFVYVLFFHPEEEGRTSLLSMHRYVFCSPFLYFLMFKNMSRYTINQSNLITLLTALFISLIAIGFPFGALLNWPTNPILFYAAVIVFFLIQSLVLVQAKADKYILLTVSLVNLSLQLYLFHSFLNGNWVG